MDSLCLAATRLIDRHIDFDAIMKETSNHKVSTEKISTREQTMGNEMVVHPDSPVHSVQTMVECLKLQATLSEMDLETVAIRMVMKKICDMSETHQVLMKDGNEHFFITLSSLKKAGSSLPIAISTLTHYENNFKHCLPLNVLLELHERDVVMIKDYFIVNLKNKIILKEFIWGLQQIVKESSNVGANTTVANTSTGILSHLIRYGYDPTSSNSKALKKMCGYVLFSIVKYHLLHLITLPASKSIKSDGCNIVSMICERLKNEKEVLHRCFTQMISLWVTNSSTIKASDAISTQHAWIACKQNESLTTFYKEMSSCLGLSSVVSTLANILERREVNWKYLLTFVSALLVCCSEAQKELEGLIDEKLKAGIETSSLECLMISFLLARQLSLEGRHAFTSYASWFQSHFGSHSKLLSSNRSFRFFIKFLTDLVPFEPARFLKVHIIKPPQAPTSCCDKLLEYTTLARCRLAELGGSLPDTPEADPFAEVEQDVKNILDKFERSKKIPKFLMEASIFKKAYFVGKFLPTLLRPKPLLSVPDAKMRLIEELYRMQKIPKNMYNDYKEKSKKESQRLQETMVLDSDSFEADEKSEVQLKATLQSIEDEVQNICTRFTSAQDNACIETLQCETLTKLNRILHSIQSDSIQNLETDANGSYVIDISENCDANIVLNKLSLLFLGWLGKFQHDLCQILHNEHPLVPCLTSVLNVLSEHECIMKSICMCIWNCCTSEMPGSPLKGISVFLAVRGNVQVQIPILPHCEVVILKSLSFSKKLKNWQTVCCCNLIHAILYSLNLGKDNETMIAASKFLCYLAANLLRLKYTINSKLFHHLSYLRVRFTCKQRDLVTGIVQLLVYH